MSERLFELFDEYAAAYSRGKRPSADDFLDRAGPEREELAALLAEYLRRAPVHSPSAEDQRHLELLLAQEPPLLALRTERGLRREEVVESLADRLGVAPELHEKLRLRYHELETGQLEPARVDRRVWEALAELLKVRAGELAAWARPGRPLAAGLVFQRSAEPAAPLSHAATEEPSEPDDVDRLFGLA